MTMIYNRVLDSHKNKPLRACNEWAGVLCSMFIDMHFLCENFVMNVKSFVILKADIRLKNFYIHMKTHDMILISTYIGEPK